MFFIFRKVLMGTKRVGDFTSFVTVTKHLKPDMPPPRWSKYKDSVLIAEFLEPKASEKIAAFDLVDILARFTYLRAKQHVKDCMQDHVSGFLAGRHTHLDQFRQAVS